MSVIQSIRDKYARIAVIAIGVSLVGFILMDAFTGRSNMFDGGTDEIGSINGKTIKTADFDAKVKAQEEASRQQGYDMGDAGRQQVIEGVWNQEIAETLMQGEYDALGIDVSAKEVNDFLFGANPPADLKQQFTDSATGQYNAQAAQQTINQMKKSGAEGRDRLGSYVDAIKAQRRQEKYNSLFINTVYFPKWFVEKQTADNSLIAKVAYVSVPYGNDTTIKVSDSEINEYISARKKEFEQKTETRSISYVLFNAGASAADSAAAQQALLSLKPAFDSTKDYENFLLQNNSAVSFYNGYISRSAMKQPNKEAILSAPVGVTYGPYLDAGGQQAVYAMSKIIDARQLPDTAKVRHILIATSQRNPQTGQTIPTRDDETAKKLADSVYALLKSGKSFDSLVTTFSEDPGSRDKGGVYENISTGQMTGAFNDFAFTNAVGQTGIVKTEFGYHIVEVLSHKGSSPAYKIAYFARRVEPSNETDNAANNAASQFAANSKNATAFNAEAEKLRAKGINKMTATGIEQNSYNIEGLGASRAFVKAVFAADKGDVLQPERIGDAYVVATVTDVTKPGVQSAAMARTTVEPILRNKKKAAQIRQSLGSISTLEAASAKLGQPIQTSDSLYFNGSNQGLGFESRVIGAAFNPANKGKVVPEAIEGQAGVYVLRVDAVSALPNTNGNIADQQRMLQQQTRQNLANQLQGGNNPILEALKASAKIKDNRAEIY
jgi:peptidyl-prolyl cis-trans isomerase D